MQACLGSANEDKRAGPGALGVKIHINHVPGTVTALRNGNAVGTMRLFLPMLKYQKSRKIATIASLVTSGNLPQLEWHIKGALENDLVSKEEIKQIGLKLGAKEETLYGCESGKILI